MSTPTVTPDHPSPTDAAAIDAAPAARSPQSRAAPISTR